MTNAQDRPEPIPLFGFDPWGHDFHITLETTVRRTQCRLCPAVILKGNPRVTFQLVRFKQQNPNGSKVRTLKYSVHPECLTAQVTNTNLKRMTVAGMPRVSWLNCSSCNKSLQRKEARTYRVRNSKRAFEGYAYGRICLDCSVKPEVGECRSCKCIHPLSELTEIVSYAGEDTTWLGMLMCYQCDDENSLWWRNDRIKTKRGLVQAKRNQQRQEREDRGLWERLQTMKESLLDEYGTPGPTED